MMLNDRLFSNLFSRVKIPYIFKIMQRHSIFEIIHNFLKSLLFRHSSLPKKRRRARRISFATVCVMSWKNARSSVACCAELSPRTGIRADPDFERLFSSPRSTFVQRQFDFVLSSVLFFLVERETRPRNEKNEIWKCIAELGSFKMAGYYSVVRSRDIFLSFFFFSTD